MIAELARLARKMHGKKNKRRRKLLNTERPYFKNQRERMDYADYQERGLPMGRGVVEAACKTLVSSRLKRSGMRWGMAGGQAVLTLRSVIQSDRWERAWFLLRNDFRKLVTVVEADGPKVLDPAA